MTSCHGNDRTQAWLEILPIFTRPEDGLACLRPAGQESVLIRHSGCYSIRPVVLHFLAAAGLRTSMVHSTSWREDQERLLLTHIAVVQRPKSDDTREFESRSVRRRELARGTAMYPPDLVDIEQVLEHGLRHLAWLARDDEAIRTAFDHQWLAALAPYEPEPFRAFERTVPEW